MKKRLKIITLAFVFSVSTLVGAIMPAKQVFAGGECGSGYYLLKSYAMYPPDWNVRSGTLEVYWSSGANRNCVIARCYGNCGVTKYREAWVRVDGGNWDVDAGLYKYYAGPVYTAYARGKCIDALGIFRDPVYKDAIIAYKSLNNVHCG